MTFASDELKEMRLRAFLLAFFLRIFFFLVNVAVRVCCQKLSQKYILSAFGGLTPNYPPEYFGGLLTSSKCSPRNWVAPLLPLIAGLKFGWIPFIYGLNWRNWQTGQPNISACP